MPEGFDLNGQSKAGDAVPQIPTSASEVAVRTMASDLEAMGQSGGMVNQGGPQAVQVPVTLHAPEPASSVPQAGLPQVAPAPASAVEPPTGRGKAILVTLAVIVGLAALFALGYFVLGAL